LFCTFETIFIFEEKIAISDKFLFFEQRFLFVGKIATFDDFYFHFERMEQLWFNLFVVECSD